MHADGPRALFVNSHRCAENVKCINGTVSPLVWLSWRQTVVYADRWGFALGPDQQPPGSSEQPASSGVAQHLFPNNKSSASRLE